MHWALQEGENSSLLLSALLVNQVKLRFSTHDLSNKRYSHKACYEAHGP